ncbi:MAG: aldolase [Lentisphaerae bacterium RIFOXYB12_FULL_65_16]|nr:MAG: aldolase [Lentisphaerae bacterium RIFOXYA12_64_32]OGV92102.1 MAG: aldolase [Lentisphaerae bacterium RIFOXYB12_FULL_65_16]
MDFTLRPSRVLKKLRAGEVVSTFKLNLSDSRAAEIAARAGFDCLWTCVEHIPNDWSAIDRQIMTAKAYDVDLVCRVARGSYSDYIRPLEMDATGLMVPHIMSLDDARSVVRMTRFHPVGRRALDGGNADGAYCGIPLVEYLRQANEQRFIILQIEDPEPVADLEAIAALPGYDVLFLGPGDFSHSIGAPGEYDHPAIRDVRKRIADLAPKYGKFAGTVAGPGNWQELVDMGYRFLNMGADVIGLMKYCGEMAAACGIRTPNAPVSLYGGKPV